MFHWRIPACAGFALILLAAPLRAQNPIPNPGFESWSGGQPVGWTTTSSGFPPEPFTQTSGNVAAVCPITVLGDVNVTGDRSVSDIVYLIGYVLKGGTQPLPCLAAGDVNCDGAVSTSDIIYLVNSILKAGPAPCNVCAMISAGTWTCNPGGGTDSARYVSLMAIDSVAQLNDGVTPESLATALLAFLSSRPEYAATGQQGTSVWARFTDGRMVMIPNNFFPDTTTAEAPAFDFTPPPPEPPMPLQPLAPPNRRAPEPGSAALTYASVPTPTCGLPRSCRVALFQSVGSLCYHLSDVFLEWALFGKGYDVVARDPSVNELALVQDIGVFHINSHGGICQSRSNVFITGIWTTTGYSKANDVTLKPQLDADELVYMYARCDVGGGQCELEWRYAFTGKFVSTFMQFQPNSLVYIGACYSDAPSLRNGFKTAGASVYCGWTNPVNDRQENKTSEFLFDRLSGHNGSKLTPVESPKQRPFDLASVHQDMISRGLDFDLKNLSELHITELNPGFGILNPSIRYVYVVPFTDTLFLTGLFGENPGTRGHVFVDGQEQTIYDWQPTFIWASIPRSGPGWAGTMIVQVDPEIGTPPNPRQSNKVNLTGWTGQFTYTKAEQGSLLGTVAMYVSFRADVHPFRESPHTTPKRNPLNYFGGDLSSYAVGYIAGQYQYVVPGEDPPEVLTWSWDGTTPPFFVPPTGSTSVDPWGEFLLQGNVNGTTDSLNLFLFVTAGGASTTMETLVSSKHGANPPTDVVLSPNYLMYDSPPATLRLGFTSGFVIEGGPRVYNECCSSYPNDFVQPDIVHKLDWNAIVPVAAPDPNEAQ